MILMKPKISSQGNIYVKMVEGKRTEYKDIMNQMKIKISTHNINSMILKNIKIKFVKLSNV